MDRTLTIAANDEVRSNARRAYLILRERIIECTILPMQKLKIAELAAELDVSSGAIREALSRLTTEQLVVAEDQRGFRAAPITPAELDDLTEARIEIEALLLRRAIARADADWHAEIRAAAWEMNDYAGDPISREAADLHTRFHETLVAACDSPSLLRIRQSLYEMSQRYRYLAARQTTVTRHVADEHEAITAAVLAGDQKRAVATMTRHIRKTTEVLRKVLSSDLNGPTRTGIAKKIHFSDDDAVRRD